MQMEKGMGVGEPQMDHLPCETSFEGIKYPGEEWGNRVEKKYTVIMAENFPN